MLLAKSIDDKNPLQVFLSKVERYYYGDSATQTREDNRMLNL